MNAVALVGEHQLLPVAERAVPREPVPNRNPLILLASGHPRPQRERLASGMHELAREHVLHERFDAGARRPPRVGPRDQRPHETGVGSGGIAQHERKRDGGDRREKPEIARRDAALQRVGHRLSAKSGQRVPHTARGEFVGLIDALQRELDAGGQPTGDVGHR